MWSRLSIACLVTLAGCHDAHRDKRENSPLETAIARDLTARLSTSVTVSCPKACTATLADGTVLPIVLEPGGGETGWRVDGIVIDSSQVATYVTGELEALKVKETVTCTPPVQVVQPGDRVRCALSGGGAAFVQVAADGSTSLELALDSAAAAARGEVVTPERDRELTARSKALENAEGESDGEEEGPSVADGGVPQP